MLDIEINSLNEDKKRGRLNFVMTALTIHERGQWNKRGLTWLEENVKANIDSAIGMPIVVAWLVDREIPSDHGSYEFDEDGNRYFYDSDTVGCVQKAYIAEATVDGVISKKLICEGYIFQERYPKFCTWMKESIKNGDHIKGSVEIDGKGESKQIIYENKDVCNEDGSFKMGRIPVVFDFTGLAILSDIVRPADNGSELIELNTLNNNINKEKFQMEKQIEELKVKIEELTNALSACNVELDACKQEVNVCKEKESELNAIIVEANKTIESQKVTIEELDSEIKPLRELKEKIENDAKISEINSYFEVIKSENGFSEAELNSLKEEFVDKCDLEGLKLKEQELCVAKLKEMKRLESIQAELNSHDDDTLFFSTKVELSELNSEGETDGSELFN